MATNRDIIASSFEQRNAVVSEPTAGLAVVAFLLVLILGFSAIDIQRQHALDVDHADGLLQEHGLLDGRGKWGGYL